MQLKVSPCAACEERLKPDKLCAWCEFGGHSVKLQVASGIVVPDVANISGSIQKVDIIWNGQPVTKVPVGEKFDVNMYFAAYNSGGGCWCIAGTVVATDNTLPNYEISKNNCVSTSMGPGYITPNKYGQLTMPNHDITLRVKLWGFPLHNDVPPDRSLW